MRHYRRIPTPAHLRVINVRLKHKVPYPVGGFLGGGERMERSSRTTLVLHYMHDESVRILQDISGSGVVERQCVETESLAHKLNAMRFAGRRHSSKSLFWLISSNMINMIHGRIVPERCAIHESRGRYQSNAPELSPTILPIPFVPPGSIGRPYGFGASLV
jgi:hypothetical protein